MAPLGLIDSWGTLGSWLTPLLIGIGFGAVLEQSGFGDSRKLAAQFYLKDMTVLKVMFTAIIVAAVLIGFSGAIGILEINRVWVNHTYLLPGLIGGLVMGVGFIIGGFCPGTSLVAASTFKIDGVLFVLGGIFGIFLFGETVHLYQDFYHSTFLGRWTLSDLFGVDDGVVITLIVAMALLMFMFAGISENYFGKGLRGAELKLTPRKYTIVAGSALFIMAVVTAIIGQPSPEKLWELKSPELSTKLEDRSVYVPVEEVRFVLSDNTIYSLVLDFRHESDYNLFHLMNSRNVDFKSIYSRDLIKELKAFPNNHATLLIANDDVLSTEAWKLLTAQGVQNLFIVEGGINAWLKAYPPTDCMGKFKESYEPDQLSFAFNQAFGILTPAFPYTMKKQECGREFKFVHIKEPEERKVKLGAKPAAVGGCG